MDARTAAGNPGRVQRFDVIALGPSEQLIARRVILESDEAVLDDATATGDSMSWIKVPVMSWYSRGASRDGTPPAIPRIWVILWSAVTTHGAGSTSRSRQSAVTSAMRAGSLALIHRTCRIRDEHSELRDDGDLDRLRVVEPVGQGNECFSLLQHRAMADDEVVRSGPLVLRELHERAQPSRDVASLGERAEALRTHHQRAAAPRVGALRERGIEMGAPRTRASASHRRTAPRGRGLTPAGMASWLIVAPTG